MIKKITALLMLLSLVTFGQTKQRVFDFGPKVAINLAKTAIINNPTAMTSQNKIDLGAGLFGRINFTPKLSLQSEVYYQNRGGAFKNPASRNKYQLLSVPVLLGYSPIKGVIFEGGVEYSKTLNQGAANLTRSIYGPDVSKDLGAIVGVRINMLDALSLFSLNIRYSYGFMDLSTQRSNGVPLDFRSRGLQVGITYNFSEYYSWWKKYGEPIKKKKKK